MSSKALTPDSNRNGRNHKLLPQLKRIVLHIDQPHQVDPSLASLCATLTDMLEQRDEGKQSTFYVQLVYCDEREVDCYREYLIRATAIRQIEFSFEREESAWDFECYSTDREGLPVEID